MSPFWRVVRRELRSIGARPYLILVALGVPIFCAIFMATIFGQGEMYDLPIGVVDQSHSATSRSLIRAIDASPKLRIAGSYTSTSEALTALKTRDIFGFVVLPRELSEATVGACSTQIPYFYHYAFLSIGGEVESNLRRILLGFSMEPALLLAEELGTPPSEATAVFNPIGADLHPLLNPTLNYRTYLAGPFTFIMFQIVVMLLTIYVVGRDVEQGLGDQWLTTADGSMARALGGKLLPHTAALTASGILALGLLAQFGAIPRSGELWRGVIDVVLLVASSQGLALLIYSIYPDLGTTMSLVSMTGSLGATLSGVTFPAGSFYAIFRHLAEALPVRHFMQLFEADIYGNMTTNRPLQIVILVAFTLLPSLLLGRLRRAIISRRYERKTTK